MGKWLQTWSLKLTSMISKFKKKLRIIEAENGQMIKNSQIVIVLSSLFP